MATKDSHRLEGHDISVQLHLPCLGVPNGNVKGQSTRFPDDLQFDNIESAVLSFITKRKRPEIEEQMERIHANVVWPNVGTGITIECTLTKQVEGWKMLSEEWPSTVSKKYAELFQIYVKETVKVSPEFEPDVKQFLDDVAGNDISVRFEDSTSSVEVIGEKGDVTRFIDSLQKVSSFISYTCILMPLC